MLELVFASIAHYTEEAYYNPASKRGRGFLGVICYQSNDTTEEALLPSPDSAHRMAYHDTVTGEFIRYEDGRLVMYEAGVPRPISSRFAIDLPSVLLIIVTHLNKGSHNIAFFVLRSLGKIIESLFPKTHPVWMIISHLLMMETNVMSYGAIVSFEILRDSLRSVFGPLHGLSLRCGLIYADCVHEKSQPGNAGKMNSLQLLHSLGFNLDEGDQDIIKSIPNVRSRLVGSNVDDAWQVGQEVIGQALSLRSEALAKYYTAVGLHILARCRLTRGEIDLATQTLRWSGKARMDARQALMSMHQQSVALF